MGDMIGIRREWDVTQGTLEGKEGKWNLLYFNDRMLTEIAASWQIKIYDASVKLSREK